MKYRVTLPGRPPGTVDASARAMADAFGISESKAAGLLERTPGPLTKPIGEREAVRVAYTLRRLGLAVEVTPVETEDAVTPTAAGAPKASSAGASAGGATAGASRSPFLSQVDEAPPPIPGLGDLGDAASDDDADASTASHPSEERAGDGDASGERPAASARPDAAVRARAGLGGSTRAPTPYAPTGVGALPRRGGAASPFRGRLVLAAVLPGLVALAAAWIAFSLVDGGADDATLAGVAVSHAESFGVLLGGRDPSAVGPRGELREALFGASDALAARGIVGVAVAGPSGEVLAAWPTDVDAAVGGVDAPGWAGLVARAQASSGVVLGDAGAPGWRAAAAPIRVRGNPVAVTLALGEAGPPLGRAGIAMGVGLLALLLTALVAWWANRGWLRDHDRLLAETVRISRGDLGRPVEPSARFPDAVQALERIRVSLLEGLERLRRRKR